MAEKNESSADAREANDKYYARNIKDLLDKLNAALASAYDTGLQIRARIDELPSFNAFGVIPPPPIVRVVVELSRPIKAEGDDHVCVTDGATITESDETTGRAKRFAAGLE